MSDDTAFLAASQQEQQEIEAMKARDDFPGLGQKVQSLYKMPQSLCKMRGNCCRIVTFKGLRSYPEIQQLAASDDPDATNAKDFLTLFQPHANVYDVQEMAPVFVERVLAQTDRMLEEVGFFKCRFLGENGACQIHEDRPTGCRVYPFPHQQTIYHPGCGFEQTGLDHANKIQDILAFFNKRLNELTNSADQISAQISSDEVV